MNWVQEPALSSNFFSPGNQSGTNYTILSFSIDSAASYAGNITAYYEPLNREGLYKMDYGPAAAAYYMPNGTWLVALLNGRFNPGDARNISLGIGTDPANLQWEDLGLSNFTDGMAVAAMGSKIRVVYLEKNATATYNSHGVQWVKYFASDNWGATWTNGTLWDKSSTIGCNWFGTISMAANSTGFECLWDYAQWDPSDPDHVKHSELWEMRDIGSGWTTPKLFGPWHIESWAPEVMFDEGENLIVAFNWWSSVSYWFCIYRCPLGPDSSFAQSWYPFGTDMGFPNDFPYIYTAFDTHDSKYYFIDIRMNPTGVSNATWSGTPGAIDYFQVDNFARFFNLWAHDGPKVFTLGASSNIAYFNVPGILDCTPPFFFRHFEGSVVAQQVAGYYFDGTDFSQSTHNASAYMFELVVGELSRRFLVAGVDRTVSPMQVATGHTIFSPAASPGVQDTFALNVTTTKAGTATLSVESLSQQFNASTYITDGIYKYMGVAICGDGQLNFVFFLQMEGTTFRLMVAKSSDGGLTWGVPRPLRIVEPTDSPVIRAVCSGTNVYCWETGFSNHFFFMSTDAGESFTIYDQTIAVLAVTSDLICWGVTFDPTKTWFNITKSSDFGFSWTTFLLLPQNPFKIAQTIDSAVMDPVSGNYSFALTNSSEGILTLLTVTYDGVTYTRWDDLGVGGYAAGSGYLGTVRLGSRRVSGSWETILLSSAYNSPSLQTMMAPLAYRTTTGGGGITDWANFTGISGDKIYATNPPDSPGYWDIFFVGNLTPCFVNLIWNLASATPKQIQVFAGTSLVYSDRITIAEGSMEDFSFAGVSGTGQTLPEGDYRWTITFLDLVSHLTRVSGVITIDNTLPSLGLFVNMTSPRLPSPLVETQITIPASDLHLGSGAILRYRNATSNWTDVAMTTIVISPTESNFTGSIPSTSYSDRLYWQAIFYDLAGNALVVDDNGNPFSYGVPNLRLEEEFEPPERIDLTLTPEYQVRIVVPEDAEYMDYLLVQYTLDDGSGLHSETMTTEGAGIYSFTFANFPRNVTSLNYTIIGVDVFGNQVTLGRYRALVVVPALPAWEMSAGAQVVAFIASLIVGLCTGGIYTILVRRRTEVQPIIAEMGDRAKVRELEKGREKPLAVDTRKASFIIAGIIMGILLGAALVTYFIFRWEELTMLLLTGLFLATTFLWVIVTDFAVGTSLRSGAPKMKHTFLALSVGLSIFIVLLVIMMVGDNLAWWRVRVNEQAYSFAGITLPKMLSSLASTFFTSILLLTMSASKDVSRIGHEIKEMETNNENPGHILAYREAAISRTMGAVGQKGILFIAIIGFTIIFASDLTAYLTQGIIIIIPFAIGTIVTMTVNILWKKIRSKAAPKVLLDHLITCPVCHQQTALGGNFCEKCGTKLIAGTRQVQSVTCAQCHRENPEGSKHCRSCGTKLSG